MPVSVLKICAKQRADRSIEIAVHAGGMQPAQQADGTHCGTIMLGPGPVGNIECAVRVDPRLAAESLAMRSGEILIAAQKALIVRCDGIAPGAAAQNTAVELLQRQAEADEIGEVPDDGTPGDLISEKDAQRIDHNRRVPVPMKK